MRLAPVTLALLAALILAPPALAAKTHTTNIVYRVTKAEGSETATFAGDGTPTCAAAGLCGYSGTASFTFGHVSQGVAIFTLQRRGKRRGGFGDFEYGIQGTTASNVAQAGVAQPCVDSVKHRSDALDVEVTPKSVLIGFHPVSAGVLGTDYLGTHCAGPTEPDMATARALPAIEIPLGPLRSRKRLDFGFHSNKPFHVGPFSGSLKVDAEFTLVRDKKTERRLNKQG